MAAPTYVPTTLDQQPRRGLPLPPARPWRAERSSDLHGGQPLGPGLGNPGPDQGYALVLARRFEDRLHLTEGEDRDDVVAGCVGVAIRRSALFGRAPVIHDLELAFAVWGYLTPDPPAELVELRRRLFAGAAIDYWDQRSIVDRVPDETLRLTPAQVAERVATDWRSLLVTD